MGKWEHDKEKEQGNVKREREGRIKDGERPVFGRDQEREMGAIQWWEGVELVEGAGVFYILEHAGCHGNEMRILVARLSGGFSLILQGKFPKRQFLRGRKDCRFLTW